MGKLRKRQSKRGRQQRPFSIPLLFTLGGILLVGAMLLAFWRGGQTEEGAPESGAPNLVVDRELVDFGDVPVGEWITASFTLTNTGNQPVRFTRAPYIEVAEGC